MLGWIVLFCLILGIVLVHRDQTAAGSNWERERHEQQEMLNPKKYNRVLDGRNEDMGRKG